jgi:hypothetical protein
MDSSSLTKKFPNEIHYQEIRPSFDSRVEFGFQFWFQNQILFETWFWFQLQKSNLILALYWVTRTTQVLTGQTR